MSSLAVLSKPVGPMPLGAWIVVGAGGLFLAWRAEKASVDGPAAVTSSGPAVSSNGEIDAADGAPAIVNVVVYVPDTSTGGHPVVPSPAGATAIDAARPIPVAKPVVKPAVPSALPVAKPAAVPVRKHTVVSGDTLSAIGAHYGIAWTRIYDRNVAVIEAAARSHGRVTSDHGHWIYPGTVLVIP